MESVGESEIIVEMIGNYVMEGLKGVDDVVYVWFVFVYKNFWEVKDFEVFLDELNDFELS